MNVKFLDCDHENFFGWIRAEDGCGNDPYRLALFYLLGVCDTMRQNYKDIYDIKERIVNVESIKNGWQTGTTIRLTRLGLNLYNG